MMILAAIGNTALPTIIIAFLALGSLAYWVGWRLKVPSILLLLATGFAIGPGFELLDPDTLLGDALFPLVSAAVAIILFEGGLTLRLRDLKDGGSAIWRLTFIGVAVTSALAGFLAWWLLGLQPLIAALLGALLSVTGPTVIGPMLRTIRLPSRLKNVVKWEGILIDPVGVLLAVLIFEMYLSSGTGPALGALAKGLVVTLVVSTVFAGLASGFLMLAVRHRLLPEFLHNQVILTLVLGTFFGSNAFQEESGLFTVTLFGAILANQRVFRFEHIIHFKENLRTLLISGLFLVLAARVDRETLSLISMSSLFFLAGLVLLVRPISVMLSTVGTELPTRERLMLMMLAPRGIVATALSSVFVLKLTQIGAPEADKILAVTLLVVTGTVLVYGLGAGWVAKRLGLANPSPGGLLIVGAHEWARRLALQIRDAGGSVVLVDSNPFNIDSAKLEGLKAYQGNVLSDEFLESIDLSDVGWAVCMTANNEVNAFARTSMTEFLERTHIFRLVPEAEAEAEAPLNPLFGQDVTYDFLRKQLARGGQFETSTIKESTKAASWAELPDTPKDAVLLFAISSKRGIHVFTQRDKYALEPGDKLVYMKRETSQTPPVESLQEDILSESPF
jgi:NhaP-type Na+/H+ or K+/H+ antiporter